MNYNCIILEGTTYQPKGVYRLDNSIIIPATKQKSVLKMDDLKLVFVTPEGVDKNSVYYFVLTYQFLFPKSYIYYFYSLPHKPIIFTESGKSFEDIESIISQKYESGGSLVIDFENIDSFHTSITDAISLKSVYGVLKEKYGTNERFRNMIDLYLYTVGTHHKLYDNLFQKIAQLQTVFESIIGKPKQEQKSCGHSHYVETWGDYIERRLGEIGIANRKYRDLIIKIKSELNNARVKYTHDSAQYNTFKESIKELRTGTHYDGQSSYTTNFNDILDNTLKVKDWSSLDWGNACKLYETVIIQLIYFEFLKVK